LRVIPDRGQVPENLLKPSSKQACDVLHDRVLRSNLANESRKLRPKPRALAGEPSSLASERNILTGETAADEIWKLSMTVLE
jgi:hypothetical protein